MMHPPEEQFSEFVDQALAPNEAAAIEVHLAGCEACRTLVQDLRRVVQRAQALEDRPPAGDLWPGVAAAIGAASRRRRRLSFSMPELLAASVALMLFSGSAGLWFARRQASTAPTSAVAAPTMSAVAVPAGTRSAAGYSAALLELEQELARNRDLLDSTTIRVVDEKLALIDRAIAEAERALATDSSDTYLHSHLAQTRLRKLELLRRAAALTRQVS